MKYIIMCGGNYPKFEKPKQLIKVNNEVLVERTIRLLKENGIEDIAICTNSDKFDYLGLPILLQENKYISGSEYENKKSEYCWLNAYYPVKEPACYLHGDVYFTPSLQSYVQKNIVSFTFVFTIVFIASGLK